MKNRIVFAIILCAVCSKADADIDVRSYSLHLAVKPTNKTIDGIATIELVADGDKTITLDFVGMTVSQVQVNSVMADWTLGNQKLTITPIVAPKSGETAVLDIQYNGSPQPYIAPWGTWGLVFEEERVFAVNVTKGARYWFPCNDRLDDKATFSVSIEVPDGWTVAAPGELKSNEQGTWVWNANWPIPTYLMVFYAGKYELVEKFYDNIPLKYYLHPTSWESARKTFDHVPTILSFLTDRYGDYPFPKVGFAEINLGGAVEVPSCIGLGSQVLAVSEPMVEVIAHELAHTWFQGVVTIKSWEDLWLSEGMATYHEALFQESLKGFGGLKSYTKSLGLSYKTIAGLGEGWFPLTTPEKLFGVTVYRKGALVFHALRFILGDETFKKTLLEYLKEFDLGSASTEDFKKIAEKTSGKNLDDFFAQWVQGVGYPQYAFAWRRTGEDTSIDLYIEQEQPWQVFTTPIEIEFLAGEKSFRTRVDIAGKETTEKVDPGFVPETVTLDPDGWILKDVKEIEFPKPILDAGPVKPQTDGMIENNGCSGCKIAGDFSWLDTFLVMWFFVFWVIRKQIAE
ncbi:MAG: M1 family metallopeptidase [Pseudomonadota bacterium]